MTDERDDFMKNIEDFLSRSAERSASREDESVEVRDYALELVGSLNTWDVFGFFQAPHDLMRKNNFELNTDYDSYLYFLVVVPTEIQGEENQGMGIPVYIGVKHVIKDKPEETFVDFQYMAVHRDLIDSGDMVDLEHRLGERMGQMEYAFMYKLLWTYIIRNEESKVLVVTAPVKNDFCPYCVRDTIVRLGQTEDDMPYMTWNESFDFCKGMFFHMSGGTIDLLL